MYVYVCMAKLPTINYNRSWNEFWIFHYVVGLLFYFVLVWLDMQISWRAEFC